MNCAESRQTMIENRHLWNSWGTRLVVFLCLLSLGRLPAMGADPKNLEISIEPDRLTYASGAPIELTATTCNPTNEAITFQLACPCCNQDLDIVDDGGAVVASHGPSVCATVVVPITVEAGECIDQTYVWPQIAGELIGVPNQQGTPVEPGEYMARFRWYPLTMEEQTVFSAPFTIESGPCTGNVLCLGEDQRFQVRVIWGVDGTVGSGVARQDTSRDTGSFWFFNPENMEVVVKVLDGRSINGFFWVYLAGLTDVGFELEVIDSETGNRVVYENFAGTQASRGDIMALPGN